LSGRLGELVGQVDEGVKRYGAANYHYQLAKVLEGLVNYKVKAPFEHL